MKRGIKMIPGMISTWLYLLFLAIGIWATIGTLLKKKLSPAWKLGLFLALYDFAFQTTGGLAGLWTSHKSVLFLGLVPIEVFFIAFMAGMVYYWIIPRDLDNSKLFAILFLISAVGTIIEAILLSQGFLTYDNWNSFLAMPAYFISFWILHQARIRIRS